MKIYYSSARRNDMIDNLIFLGVRNFLYSYEDKRIFKFVHYLADRYNTPETKCTILIDSGAFSAWNRGLVIDIDHYISYIDKLKEINTLHDLIFINLDVIPHVKGTKASKAQIEKAFWKGVENYNYIKQRGHITLHTYHQLESWSMLDTILRECNDLDYIGISPANDKSINERNDWLEDVFFHVRQKTRTHVLGLTALESMERFPAYSADSSSWINAVRFGELFNDRDLTKPGRTVHLARNNIFFHDPKMEFYNSTMYYVRLERYITKLWEKRGVIWKEYQ
jgi:hypothetical protein